MVTKGRIQIQIPDKPNIVMKAKDYFGENSFQKGHTRNGTAIALEKTEVLSIGREALRRCTGTALDELSCYNIIKWSLARNSLLKNLSDLQREKIISIAKIAAYQNESVIISKGSLAACFVICL